METNSISKEKLLEVALDDLNRGASKIGPTIDKFSSSKLKRILKTITHVHLAEHITKGKQMQLEADEQSLIDSIFRLQEDVMGYLQLEREIKGDTEPKETNNEETVNE